MSRTMRNRMESEVDQAARSRRARVRGLRLVDVPEPVLTGAGLSAFDEVALEGTWELASAGLVDLGGES